MRTLVLNAGYEPMQLINWERAICLVMIGKAEIIAEYNRVIRTVSREYSLPSVVRLKRYVRMVKRLGMVRCTRKNILLRDNHQCQYCGVTCHPAAITIDHVIPKCKGGRTTWNNVVAACANCNRRKGDRPLSECGMSLLKTPARPTWHEIMREDEPFQDEWLAYMPADHSRSG